MGTFIGKFVKSFADADHAACGDMHLNSDYPHKSFDVISSGNGSVKLKSHSGRGEEFDLKVKTSGNGFEFAEIQQSSSYERIFGGKPCKFKIWAMKSDKEQTP